MTIPTLTLCVSIAIILIAVAILCLYYGQKMIWDELRFLSGKIKRVENHKRFFNRPNAKEADKVIMEILRRW